MQRLKDGFGLSVAADLSESMIQRLSLFRFRSKVDFQPDDDSVDVSESDAIRAGRPLIATAQSELWTPHMLNLDLLDAISFDKGCYTGQEIVARTHYKGATKRRMLRQNESS